MTERPDDIERLPRPHRRLESPFPDNTGMEIEHPGLVEEALSILTDYFYRGSIKHAEDKGRWKDKIRHFLDDTLNRGIHIEYSGIETPALVALFAGMDVEVWWDKTTRAFYKPDPDETWWLSLSGEDRLRMDGEL